MLTFTRSWSDVTRGSGLKAYAIARDIRPRAGECQHIRPHPRANSVHSPVVGNLALAQECSHFLKNLHPPGTLI